MSKQNETNQTKKENKMNNEQSRPQNINEIKWYKSAKLPWGIITGLALVVAAFIGGWHANQSYVQSVEAKAAAFVSAKTPSKQ